MQNYKKRMESYNSLPQKQIFLCQAVVGLCCHAKYFCFVCRKTLVWCLWNADWHEVQFVFCHCTFLCSNVPSDMHLFLIWLMFCLHRSYFLQMLYGTLIKGHSLTEIFKVMCIQFVLACQRLWMKTYTKKLRNFFLIMLAKF